MANEMLEKIILEKDVNRIVSPFQCLSLREKIKQNLLTSSNIVFGNKLENLMKDLLISRGAVYSLPRRLEGYDYDQLCFYQDKIILIEQKIRDDHDSSKKRGQLDNYLDKRTLIMDLYPNHKLISFMWFIDPSFKKIKSFIKKTLRKSFVMGKKSLII